MKSGLVLWVASALAAIPVAAQTLSVYSDLARIDVQGMLSLRKRRVSVRDSASIHLRCEAASADCRRDHRP
jgi:hypothetical protein